MSLVWICLWCDDDDDVDEFGVEWDIFTSESILARFGGGSSKRDAVGHDIGDNGGEDCKDKPSNSEDVDSFLFRLRLGFDLDLLYKEKKAFCAAVALCECSNFHLCTNNIASVWNWFGHWLTGTLWWYFDCNKLCFRLNVIHSSLDLDILILFDCVSLWYSLYLLTKILHVILFTDWERERRER